MHPPATDIGATALGGEQRPGGRFRLVVHAFHMAFVGYEAFEVLETSVEIEGDGKVVQVDLDLAMCS